MIHAPLSGVLEDAGLSAEFITRPTQRGRIWQIIETPRVFQKPDQRDRTILILNVNPLAPAHAAEFRSDAVYETLVDTNGDAVPEIVFQYLFTAKNDRGDQFATVLRTDLTQNLQASPAGQQAATLSLVINAPVSLTSEAHITHGHEGAQFFAGFRSDPFFFDLLGFLNGLKFTGADFFIDKNVFGIALDLPSRLLGPNPKVGIWTRTRVPMTLQPDRLAQVDQMGRPGINTVLNHGNDKNDHRNVLSTEAPTSGQTFLSVFQQELQALSADSPQGQYTADQAMGIAQILLPDVLTYDYTSSAGYLNGRRLQDDVIDISLNLVTNGKVTGDGVGPHTDYLADFPYLGNPHV
ncbi:MAG: DUF4331 domain-containing protein [Chloroflexi bacterium]|nr:MAG: DUF4331 domain-containing protein [Chloroflexota bacterium]